MLHSEIKDGSIVLDIGGYDGFISYQLRDLKDLNITVVDLDKEALEAAQRKGLRTLWSSALSMPIQDSSVDVVLCLDLIEHVEEDTRLIREISRVLKKSAKIILTTPMSGKALIPFLNMDVINKQWGHVRNGYTLEQIKCLFRNNQLCLQKCDRYQNIFSRYAYYFAFLSGIPLRGKYGLYRAVIRLEPFIKIGAWEHVILGQKL